MVNFSAVSILIGWFEGLIMKAIIWWFGLREEGVNNNSAIIVKGGMPPGT